MKRIFVLLICFLNLGICQAQEQSSFFQRLLEGLFSIIGTTTQNTGGMLTQNMINASQGSITLAGAYDMDGKTIVLPSGFKLIMDGGTLANGTIKGDNSSIQASSETVIFEEDVKIDGTWNQAEIHDTWFALSDSVGHVANGVINNILTLASDKVTNRILFTSGRTYYFEMPYKGRADLGNVVYNYKDKNGTTQRRYSDLMKDDYDYLRIFTIPSNTSILLNSTLKMIPTNQGAYFVFWEYGKENISIEGNGSVIGDVKDHLYTSPFAGKYYFGEYGHLFIFQKCHNVSMKGITIDGAFGDGILFRGSLLTDEKGDRYGSGFTADHLTIRNARRNGMAIAARDVKITNCHFEGCGTEEIKGTAPHCAIDFEADKISTYKSLGNQNVVMDNCTFKNNRLDISSYHNNLNEYGKNATTISNCIFTAPCKLNTTFWMTFKNCKFTSFYDAKSTKSEWLYCRHLVFDTCEFKKVDSSCIKNAKNVAVTLKNCKY